MGTVNRQRLQSTNMALYRVKPARKDSNCILRADVLTGIVFNK